MEGVMAAHRVTNANDHMAGRFVKIGFDATNYQSQPPSNERREVQRELYDQDVVRKINVDAIVEKHPTRTG